MKSKKKKARRKRLPSIQSLKRKAWNATKRSILSQDARCVTCGGKATQTGHFIHTNDKKGKSNDGNAVWYEPRNLAPQCTACNRWKHGNLVAYALYLEQRYGHGIVQELWTLFKTPKKWSREELQDLQDIRSEDPQRI